MTVAVTDWPDNSLIVPANIPAGQALSAVIDTGGMVIVGCELLAAGTSANLALKGSLDNTTFVPVTESLGNITASLTNLYKSLLLVSFQFCETTGGYPYFRKWHPRYVKLWSETTGVDTVQIAQLNVRLLLFPSVP